MPDGMSDTFQNRTCPSPTRIDVRTCRNSPRVRQRFSVCQYMCPLLNRLSGWGLLEVKWISVWCSQVLHFGRTSLLIQIFPRLFFVVNGA